MGLQCLVLVCTESRSPRVSIIGSSSLGSGAGEGDRFKALASLAPPCRPAACSRRRPSGPPAGVLAFHPARHWQWSLVSRLSTCMLRHSEHDALHSVHYISSRIDLDVDSDAWRGFDWKSKVIQGFKAK